MFGLHHEKPVNPLDTNTTDDLVRKAAASGSKILPEVGKPAFDFNPDNVKAAQPKTPAEPAKAPVEDELAGPGHERTDDEVSQIGSPVPPATV